MSSQSSAVKRMFPQIAKKKLSCPRCPKSFSNKYGLKRHLSGRCKGDPATYMARLGLVYPSEDQDEMYDDEMSESDEISDCVEDNGIEDNSVENNGIEDKDNGVEDNGVENNIEVGESVGTALVVVPSTALALEPVAGATVGEKLDPMRSNASRHGLFSRVKQQPVSTEIIATNLGSTVDDAALDQQHFQENVLRQLNNLRDQIAKNKSKGNGEDDGKSSDEDKKDEEDPKIDIVCLAKGDYVKKIIQLYDGDEEKAMNYIKNVGIATDFLEGDFRMIKKIYFDGKKKSQFPIRVKDYKRNKLEYLEENGEWILDIRGEIVGKRLCDNLVATLLVANTQFNEVIINEPDEERKAVLLDIFQINKTQAHILKLTERKTQGKMSRRVAEFITYCKEVQDETGSLDNVKKVYE